jgi:hypothetical protein
VAGFRSEPWPASSRNGWPASYWNAWPASSESAPWAARLAVVLAVVVAGLTSAMAQAPPNRLAIQNAIDEFVVCSTFYLIAAQCIRNTPPDRTDLANSLDGYSERSFGTAIELSQALGLKAETPGAKLKLFHDDQMRQIGRDCANISILMTRHLDRCNDMMKDPRRVLSR